MNLPVPHSPAEREAFLALQARLPALLRDVFSGAICIAETQATADAQFETARELLDRETR